MAAMQMMLPLMMMSSACLSCSSCCGSLLAPIFFFWSRIAALFSFLNPFKAAGKVGGAVKGAARGAARAARGAARGASRAARGAARGASRAARGAARGVGRAARGVRNLFRRRCFSPETIVKLQDGRSVMMKDLKLGDVLINGSIVDAVMKIKNEDDQYYKLPGDILVTGTHYVRYGGKYIRVKDVPGAKPTGTIDPVVYCLVTSDHKIPVGEYTFWDWEDNLIPTRENVDTIFKKLKAQRSVTVK
jgi:hypothetical protein